MSWLGLFLFGKFSNPPFPSSHVRWRCGDVEATGLAWALFVLLLSTHVLSANRVDLGFVFHKFSYFTLSPSVFFCFLFGVSDFGSWLVISTFTPMFFIEISFVSSPPPRPVTAARKAKVVVQDAGALFGGPATILPPKPARAVHMAKGGVFIRPYLSGLFASEIFPGILPQ